MNRGVKRIGLCCLCLLFVSCHRADLRTVEIHVPAMNDEEAAQRVTKALDVYADYGIIQKAEADIARNLVCITYNSTRTALKNLEYLIARAGFDANDTRADDVLPPSAPESQP